MNSSEVVPHKELFCTETSRCEWSCRTDMHATQTCMHACLHACMLACHTRHTRMHTQSGAKHMLRVTFDGRQSLLDPNLTAKSIEYIQPGGTEDKKLLQSLSIESLDSMLSGGSEESISLGMKPLQRFPLSVCTHKRACMNACTPNRRVPAHRSQKLPSPSSQNISSDAQSPANKRSSMLPQQLLQQLSKATPQSSVSVPPNRVAVPTCSCHNIARHRLSGRHRVR